MAFGNKFSRESAEKVSGDVSTSMVWSFPKGSTLIHLLDDLDSWTEYWEHYDANVKKYFPCTGDKETCPGCRIDLSASHRWLANALVVETDHKMKPGYVNLFKFPKSIMAKVMRHADRKTTLLDHDFEVIRTGDGMDAEYDLEAGDKDTSFDFEKYRAQATDHEEALQAMFDEYVGKVGAPAAPAAAAPAPVQEERKMSLAERKAARQAEEAPVTVGSQATMTADEAKAAAAGDPPSEPQSPEASAEGAEEQIISEESIRKMSMEEISDLARRGGLEPPEAATTASELADWLIETLDEA